MRRFQNATMEYNVNKNDLVLRDVNTNGIFFAIEFFENTKQIKRVFTLYPVSIEIKKGNILELKFSVQNENSNQSLLTLILELNQLVADKRSIINISNEKLMNYQTKESQNMYGILNQLLLKDVLENYDGTLQELIKKHNSK